MKKALACTSSGLDWIGFCQVHWLLHLCVSFTVTILLYWNIRVPAAHSLIHTEVQAFLLLQVASSVQTLTDELLCLVNPLEFSSLNVVRWLHPVPYDRMEMAGYRIDYIIKFCDVYKAKNTAGLSPRNMCKSKYLIKCTGMFFCFWTNQPQIYCWNLSFCVHIAVSYDFVWLLMGQFKCKYTLFSCIRKLLSPWLISCSCHIVC
jgi:hypothetical protein